MTEERQEYLNALALQYQMSGGLLPPNATVSFLLFYHVANFGIWAYDKPLLNMGRSVITKDDTEEDIRRKEKEDKEDEEIVVEYLHLISNHKKFQKKQIFEE